MLEKFSYEIPSEIRSIFIVDRCLQKYLRKLQIEEETINSITTAANEAIINAITHGNNLNATKKVTISATFSGDELQIKIKDEGKGFNYNKVKKSKDLKREGGRGITLIEHFMDKIEFKNTSCGTETLMIKKIPIKKNDTN